MQSKAECVEKIRGFSRFYTKKLGLLTDSYLNSPFSMTEARVLYELAVHTEALTASDICRELDLDAGYASRIVKNFIAEGLLERKVSGGDGRSKKLVLTDAGREAFAAIDEGSRGDIEKLLTPLTEEECRSLASDMDEIRFLFGDGDGGSGSKRDTCVIRPPRPGDYGWVVQRHGALYAEEYGFNQEFEGLVAEIVAGFIKNFDPQRENCWIAARNGRNAGCVFRVKADEATAKLRLLLVEPSARGLGLGSSLTEECLRFAKRSGYGKMTLWTNSILLTARRIYEKKGFRLVKTDSHHSFGKDLTGEIWEKML